MTATATPTTTPAAPDVDVDIAIEVRADRPVRRSRRRQRIGLALALAVPFLCSVQLSEFANTVMVQIAIAILTVAGLHVLAHLTKDPALAEPLRKRADMHRLTAGAILEKKPEDVTLEERQGLISNSGI